MNKIKRTIYKEVANEKWRLNRDKEEQPLPLQMRDSVCACECLAEVQRWAIKQKEKG